MSSGSITSTEVNEGCDSKRLGAAKVKSDKFVQVGNKVAIVASVKEITSQHGSTSLHLSVEDQGGNTIIIDPRLCERIG